VRKQTLFVLGLAAFAPDVDAISYLWGPEVYGRVHHAYTHTLLGGAILAPALAGIERMWIAGISFPRLLALNLVGFAVHLLGDLIAVWPIRLFWPWRDHDFVLRWTGDFDLVVLSVVGLATGLAAVDRLRGWERWIVGLATLLLIVYFVWMPGVAGLQ
jgi:inner membrane protein